jgi:hypothetical protein
MSLSGMLLGVINVAIYVAILLLIGAVIVWILGVVGLGVPEQVKHVYLIIVALIALYLIVSLLFGIVIPGPFRVGMLTAQITAHV